MAPAGGRDYDAGIGELPNESILAVEEEGKLRIWIDLHGDDGVRLDKEEVAVRQLDTAIRLLFDGGDVVSVHPRVRGVLVPVRRRIPTLTCKEC
jgi:hypothetical protein